ncbi:hypothetical protein CDCA_CDCA05G1522 [Cyanidium caldarium]|uniref:Uncharacterized protein n=1 Tax=Cyanidium caldarium TaxID=2771 RepID=A0AAV9IT47_CYACA|nr:hypothetical protein CDCA_CDCA05G1522 [Cyanidium caldarium]
MPGASEAATAAATAPHQRSGHHQSTASAMDEAMHWAEYAQRRVEREVATEAHLLRGSEAGASSPTSRASEGLERQPSQCGKKRGLDADHGIAALPDTTLNKENCQDEATLQSPGEIERMRLPVVVGRERFQLCWLQPRKILKRILHRT